MTVRRELKIIVLVAYPEDMPENWLDVMREDMFDMVISPFHDKDKNPTGEAKKLIIIFW